MLLLYSTIFLFRICLSSHIHTEPLISSPLGQYRGSILRNSYGKPIYSFRGIRYAEAPVGKLRFMPPLAVKKHVGVYDATQDGAICPQPTNEHMSEDCLFLNVYTPQLPVNKMKLNIPVMINFHSGGFINSTGKSSAQGPQYLLNKDIILVTFNYRLGILGFISTGTREAPGNLGCKDQVAVIKWVKDNIETFGGDPMSITLFSSGSGATSIALHLISPMSIGLFQKAIMGTETVMRYSLEKNQLNLVKKQSKSIGCSQANSEDIFNCLKEKPADVLGKSANNLFEFGNDPLLLYLPVIEEDFGQERFLTDQPVKLFREGKFQKIPIMTGFPSDSFADRALDFIRDKKRLQQLDQFWEELAPIVFVYERNTTRSRNISRTLRSFYFGDKKFENSSVYQMIKLFTDGLSGFPINRGAKLLSKNNSQPVFFYQFSYRGEESSYPLCAANTTIPCGPVHRDDLIYLLYSANYPEIKVGDSDFEIVDKMTTMWVNFAKTGKPIPQKCKNLEHVVWENFDIRSQKYLNIGRVMKLESYLNPDRFAMWNDLFPIEGFK